ncbi:MAG: RsmE family RNA methyltransferase [Candidatus Gracilibacteria bacterium]
MTLHSFFLPGFQTNTDETSVLSEKAYPECFHQISTVLRAKKGTEFYLLNNLGQRYLMRITQIEKKSMTVLCIKIESKEAENTLSLWIPLIKLPKLEAALQMYTQLGVTHFKIFRSDFTDEKIEILSEAKKERLLRIITEASEQSERFFIPTIEYLLTDFKNAEYTENIYVAVERNQLQKQDHSKESIRSVMIGPEGGWSSTEITFFKKDPRFYPLDLHCTNILRAETAAVVAVALSHSERNVV